MRVLLEAVSAKVQVRLAVMVAVEPPR